MAPSSRAASKTAWIALPGFCCFIAAALAIAALAVAPFASGERLFRGGYYDDDGDDDYGGRVPAGRDTISAYPQFPYRGQGSAVGRRHRFSPAARNQQSNVVRRPKLS